MAELTVINRKKKQKRGGSFIIWKIGFGGITWRKLPVPGKEKDRQMSKGV
jgi:hypothetical protein